MARADIAVRVAEMVALVKLEGLEKRKPDQLSGGQRQRVALARSLARRPQVLLLDEPMAALDKKLRESTQVELMELQRRLGLTFIIVTHDQDEAMTVAGRIGVMQAGRLEQVASPRLLYEEPASRWIAEFVGDINLFEGEVTTRAMHRLAVATRDAGDLVATEPQRPLAGSSVCVAIRPEKIRLARRGPAADAAAMRTRSTGWRASSSTPTISAARRPTKCKLDSGRGAARRRRQHRAARRRWLRHRPARRGLVHARRLRGAGAMSARRIFSSVRRGSPRSRPMSGWCCSSWCRSASC